MESYVADLCKREDGNIDKEYGRAGLTTEGKGEVSTLGSIHLDSPSLGLVLDSGKMILESMRSGIRVVATSEDTGVVSNGC